MKYAMPVDPRVLERDFESHRLISQIPRLTATLKSLKTKEGYAPYNHEFSEILHLLWFSINEGTGVNLRDREKLYPLFNELGRLFGVGYYPFAYRGVRLSRWDGSAISETYPNLGIGETVIPNEPRILEHLEGLAYGLRSWSQRLDGAENWAYNKSTARDKVIFKIHNPDVVLDANEYLNINKINQPFDWDELILFIQNPQILSIQKASKNSYIVTIKDN